MSASAVRRLAFRQTRRAGALLGLVFGVTAGASAVAYVRSFPTAASRAQLAATTGRDTGMSMLFGPVGSIGTVGGYTVYKGFVFLTSMGAVWALVAATRLLRGDEEQGRWALAVASRWTPMRATLDTCVGMAESLALLWAVTAGGLFAAGARPGVGFGAVDACWYAASVALPAWAFVGVAALASQFGGTRRAAVGLAGGVFGFAFVVRMVADSGGSTAWLRWATPFGWAELLQPLTHPSAGPLLVGLLAPAVMVVAAARLAGRRDVGASLWHTRDTGALRPFGLGSTAGFAVRSEAPALGAWLAGAAGCGFMFGVVAHIATGDVPDSAASMLDRYGLRGSFLRQYLGVSFLMVALVVALVGAQQVGAAARERTEGRWTTVMAGPSNPGRWVAERLVLAVVGATAAASVAGAGAWAGARTEVVRLPFPTMLGAALNVVPVAVVALGIGSLALAWSPSRAGPVCIAVVVGSSVVDLVAPLFDGLRFVERLSLFHYMALAPAQHVQPTAVVALLGLGTVLCAVGTWAIGERDVPV